MDYVPNSHLMPAFYSNMDTNKPRVFEKYILEGYISAGTYGRVFKAQLQNSDQLVAIKKFKTDKDYEETLSTGISQSAIREINLCTELHHENLIQFREAILENRSIHLIFDYCEHDLQQIIGHHAAMVSEPIAEPMLKSVFWQILNGINYLHSNWVMHRDLKPANILINSQGCVKVGDLGLARSFFRPIQPLYNSDKVVVTVWYRAPELILDSRHYTTAIDMWSAGCILGELMTLKPMFKGEELPMKNKKIPFQKHQMGKIIEVLGNPTVAQWPDIKLHPEFSELSQFKNHYNNLQSLFNATNLENTKLFNLLSKLLAYDPKKRMTAEKALKHEYFYMDPIPTPNVFQQQVLRYPPKKIQKNKKSNF